MAPRARRAWSVIRAEIRRILRETTSATSFWDDTDLQDAANRVQDKYVMLMAEHHEGWFTEAYVDDIVADQRAYAIPEGTGRIKRVARVMNPGTSSEYEVTINRAEIWSGSLQTGTDSAIVGITGMPTYRLMGEYIMLEPPIGESVTDGLRIEIEIAPARWDQDTDELDLKWPDVFESLLVYEVVLEMLAIEFAQGQIEREVVDHIARIRGEYFGAYMDYISVRSFGRVYSQPLYLGD